MHRSSSIEQLRMELLRKGLPGDYVAKTVQELADHWEDLKSEALDESLPRLQAEAIANRRLGSVEDLARSISNSMRSVTWLGRHPFIGFGILPLAGLISWWIGMLFIGVWYTGALPRIAENDLTAPVNWEFLLVWTNWTAQSAGIVLPAFCCYLARRHYCGFRWALVGCGILALHNFLHFIKVTPPADGVLAGITWGYGFRLGLPQWNSVTSAAPLVVFLVFWLGGLKQVRRASAIHN
jgi:hypothetical protein